MSLDRVVQFADLGMKSYRETYELQERLADARRKSLVPDLVLFAEHPSTINFGSAMQHNKFSAALIEEVGTIYGTAEEDVILQHLATQGISFERTSRGGGSTYIGPGQLVVYPVVDYERIVGKQLGIGEYKTVIDKLMLEVIRSYDIDARIVGVNEQLPDDGDTSRRDRKDVWVTRSGRPHKLGGKGIRAGGNVASQGFNFYVKYGSTDGFRLVDACGYSADELGTISIEEAAGRKIEMSEFKERVIRAVQKHFGYSTMQPWNPEVQYVTT